MFEYLVVGKGLFGAAAARYLSAASPSVAIVGPDEPRDTATHDGVFASHYDQGRLQRHLSRDFVWATLSHRSHAAYDHLTRESGISFYQPVDSVHVVPRSKDSVFVESAASTAERLGVNYTRIHSGRELDSSLPMLRFPTDVQGYIEHYPAGYINPRDLIRAQLAVSERQGASVLRETVVALRPLGDRVAVVTREGNTYEAGKVLLAMGAYTSVLDTLPRKLAMRVKSETIILARLPLKEVERLRGMPSMIYEITAPPIDTIYMLPPIQYPDGHYYIKMGCNTPFDSYLSTAEEMNRWVRSGESDMAKEAMANIMREVIPGLDALSFSTKRCLISYTADVWPYIDEVAGERVFVATGGNGMGAKSSDAIGKLASDLLLHGKWVDQLDPKYFRALFEDTREEAELDWGACGMARRTQPRRRKTDGAARPSAMKLESESDGPRASEGIEIRSLAQVPFERASDIAMSHLYPREGAAETPFHAAWAVVEPGETSRRHGHHESELWFIVEGQGIVTSRGQSREVGPGDVIDLPPFVDHSLHNPAAEQRIVFLTVWWQDMELASRRARAEGGEAARAPRRVMVTVTPPTPNGDLHLGHFSGPYAAADTYVRYLRMKGIDAYYVTGSDDFQSYVAGKALRTSSTPERVANHYAERIKATLAAAGVRCDQFTRSMDGDYIRRIQAMVRKLHAAGHIIAKECEYLVSPEDGRSLFEFYVSGRCSRCDAPAGGGICEECGAPNEGAQLADPVSTLGSAPLGRRTVTRLVLPLSRHADRVRALLDRIEMPTRLRALAEGLLRDGLPDVPVTQPHEWGIPCPIEGFEGQVVSSWFEMGPSMLEGIRQLDRRSGRPLSDDAIAPEAGTEIVQFFGFDNGFYYTLLYPLLHELVNPEIEPPSAFVCNEFYLLDDRKFSTSRDHAIWLHDMIAAEPVDLVRFYLAYTRPDAERTNLTMSEYHAFVARELTGAWQGWLSDLGRRVGEHLGGLSPEPGAWTEDHRRHYAKLGLIVGEIQSSYEAATFSLQEVTRKLMELVRVARAFAGREQHWAGVSSRRDEHRTALALELAAARALAQHVAPIMPDFAQRLWAALGMTGGVEAHGFDTHVAWVPAGARVDLTGALFARPRAEAPALGPSPRPAHEGAAEPDLRAFRASTPAAPAQDRKKPDGAWGELA